MKLSFVSITNYRSITDAYRLDLSNLTVLLGKNNEGKTNIIKAINLGMDILHNMPLYGRRKYVSKQLYDWHDDFPITLQKSKKIKNKCTQIRFDFTISEEETEELYGLIYSSIRDALSIYITIGEDNSLSVTVPKRGKNAKAISSKIVPISKFICDNFDIQYIPAIRSETDAYTVISELVETEISSIEDQTYRDYMDYIEKLQQEKLDLLSKKVENPLKAFLPQIQSVNLFLSDRYRRNNYLSRKNLVINIDDGVVTSLTNKGDGVKSLATIALLSQISSNNNRLIIIDEPENHLHPEAIRYINNVVQELSENNQVIISTHSPIFVNRTNISSNVIVSEGKTKKASKVTEVRDILGVICSDNLMYSDYVILVEGPSDRTLFQKLFTEDKELKKCLDNNIITIRSTGGTNNLQSEVYCLQRYCCNYLVILDGDSTGKQTSNELRQKLSVPNEQIRLITKPAYKYECELEDLYKPEIYKSYLLKNGIDINNPIFKNTSLKWSDKITQIKAQDGIEFTKEEENNYKKDICNLISTPLFSCLTESGYKLLCSFLDKVKNDIDSMGFLKTGN